jgi:hypothetical protein
MGIKLVGLHRNQTRFRVNPGQVGLNSGRVDQGRWGEAGWARHGKNKGRPDWADSK